MERLTYWFTKGTVKTHDCSQGDTLLLATSFTGLDLVYTCRRIVWEALWVSRIDCNVSDCRGRAVRFLKLPYIKEIEYKVDKKVSPWCGRLHGLLRKIKRKEDEAPWDGPLEWDYLLWGDFLALANLQFGRYFLQFQNKEKLAWLKPVSFHFHP